jgi:hypothetical protein
VAKYILNKTPTILSHTNAPTWLLHDGTDSIELQELVAHVRSGDYMITLATLLDSISDELTVENQAEATVLQQLIQNLMYIDKHYKLVKK